MVSLVTWWLLEIYFSYTAPRAPEPSSGKLFSINVHGTVVYLTRYEYLLAGRLMFFVAFYSFIVLGLLLGLLGNPFSKECLK